jgi:hypothetical protein
MNTNVTGTNRRNSLVLSVLWIGLVCAACTSEAVLVTITNTSSSYYQILTLNTGIAFTNVTSREGVATIDLPDNKDYEVSPGQPNDQGSHWFHLGGGQITFPDITRQPTAFFTNYGPTSLTIGSIPVHFRLLSGPATSVFFDPYFAPQSVSVGTDGIVNLTPTDGSPTAPRGAGFIGNWKNTFSYSFVQRTPFQLGPLGIQSMTDSSGMGTIVPSSVVYTNFVEGGISYGGFRFIIDRTDGAQPGDGSEWLFFTVPEPSVAAFCSLGGAAALLAYRRKIVGR